MKLLSLFALLTVSAAVLVPAFAFAVNTELDGHIPHKLIAQSRDLGRMPQDTQVSLSVALRLGDKVGLEDFLRRLYDPNDKEFGRFVSPQEFARRFGPSKQDVKSVVDELESQGLTVTQTSPTMLKVSGASGDVETAFGVQFHQYADSQNRKAFAATSNPRVSVSMADKITGVLGLNNFQLMSPHYVKRQNNFLTSLLNPQGTGPGGGLSPSDIQKAYGIVPSTMTGAGQVTAVFELDGYVASDISAYTSHFGIANPPTLQNILIDGYSGAAGSGKAEVTLDIELLIAVAPQATKLLVYEGPNTESGALDTFARIANDNVAKNVSSSWGSIENSATSAYLNSENTVFMQMAAQGQSVYASSGDSGAYENGSSLTVLDPASQPYVVSVGGTTITLNSDSSYKSESTWISGGGGISSFWNQPSWQAGLQTNANKGSSSMRMVPDISADADPNTGYAIYVSGGWGVYGGTSCSAPVWAGFNALINQARANAGLGPMGFPDPFLYQAGMKSQSTTFHDIADSSTNGYYPAVIGFDLATGWGSMNGANLAAMIAGINAPPAAPTGVAVASHNKTLTISWNAEAGASQFSLFRALSSAGPFSPLTSISSNSYDDAGLTNGTTYYYYVTAQSASGTSANSSTVSGAPSMSSPRAPTNLTAK